MAFVHGKQLLQALIDAGIADEQTTRVVLDIPVDGLARTYVEKLTDARVLSVLASLDGVQISRKERD